MRLLVPDDAEDVAELDMELFPDNCFNERTMRREIEAGEGWCLRLFHGELIGYAMTRSSGGMRDLLRIGVKERFRNSKHGKHLLLEVLRLSGNLGESLMLCVRKNNDLAIRWYMRHGLEIVGTLDHSWVMVRYMAREENDRPHLQ